VSSDRSTLRIVLISGPVCAGKTSLATQLRNRYDAQILKTRELILAHKPRTKTTRIGLQRAGQRLDKENGGRWVAAALEDKVFGAVERGTPAGLFVVDSVHAPGQVDSVRKAFGSSVHHIHLTAEPEELQRRYKERTGEEEVGVEYQEVKRNRT